MEGLEFEILEGEGPLQTLAYMIISQEDICQFPRIYPNI